MASKTIAIIGGGIAGLAAGCYAQMNGYRTTIFELHDLPGGLCTAWERKGFTFDGCIHYLYGSGPGQPFHQVWQELGVAESQPFIDHDEFLRVVDGDRRTFIVYCDPQRLAAHMRQIAPADAALIDALAQGIQQILVNNNRAVGVRLYNDEVYQADYVISAADGHKTIFGMLNGAYTNRAIRRRYDGRLPVHAMVQVSLGVNRDFSAEPHWTTYLLDEPAFIAGQEQRDLGLKHYCFDPSLAPPGTSALEVMLPSPYSYWQRIYGRRLYKSEQEQVAEQVLAELEKRHPGLASEVDVVDVATPVSYERYTGNWRGSTCGWLLTEQTMGLMLRGVPKTLPRLANFFMAGQWVEPGGSVPLAAMSGRNAVQFICHADGKRFVAAAPHAVLAGGNLLGKVR
jgi:phytoene dehydrogenase-like protein